jgi:hypothetical protein
LQFQTVGGLDLDEAGERLPSADVELCKALNRQRILAYAIYEDLLQISRR